MEDNKGIFTAVIKKQMEILGPDITLARVRNVPGIKVDHAGNVISVDGPTQFLLEQLTNQFVELSGLIIKKTMESILASQPMAEGSQATFVAAPQGNAWAVASTPPTRDDASMLTANHDIEELNKILNKGLATRKY